MRPLISQIKTQSPLETAASASKGTNTQLPLQGNGKAMPKHRDRLPIMKLVPQINFKKTIAKKDVSSLLKSTIGTLETPVCIKDLEGRVLLGSDPGDRVRQYPVQLAGETLGWVIGEETTAAVAALLSYVVKQEFEKRSLVDELLEKYEEIDLFQDLSTQITASLDLEEVSKLVIEEATNLIKSTLGLILLLERETGRIEPLSQVGQGCSLRKPLMLGEGIIGNIVQQGWGEIVNQVSLDPRVVSQEQGICSLICVPLQTKGQTIGAILIGSETGTDYSTKELKLLKLFAAQAAIAIEKALLYQQSRDTAERAQTQAQRLQKTLYSWQQTLVAGIAHEINNPVNFINGNLTHGLEYVQDMLELLQLYQQSYPQATPAIQSKAEDCDLDFLMADLPQLLSSMGAGVNRINEVISSLRNFSQVDRAEMKPTDLHEGIESTLMILSNRLKVKGQVGIKIIKDYGQLPPVKCYAGQLNQVFMNILSNAIDALESLECWNVGTSKSSSSTTNPSTGQSTNLSSDQAAKRPTPIIRICTEMLDNRWAVVRIEDNGPGITEDVQRRLFDTFFTTKAVGKGTGLGLAISHQIVVEKHGGVLKCLSQPGEGTEFWIQIPLEPAEDGNGRDQSLILGG